MQIIDIKTKAINKHNLQELTTVYETADKAVYFAMSKEYGKVVLKINKKSVDLQYEYKVLQEFTKQYACEVYDIDSFFLLEKRIEPGESLHLEKSLNKRLKFFVEVFKNIHRESDVSYFTYLDWLNSAWLYCEKNKASLTELMAESLKIGRELFEKYEDRVLLHGDLHHDNLLKNGDGFYTMIDSKGVSGPAIFDLPRFIQNEICYCESSTAAEHIKKVIKVLADELHYPEEDIKKLFFMEVVLGNVWGLEDGDEVDYEDIDIAITILHGGE